MMDKALKSLNLTNGIIAILIVAVAGISGGSFWIANVSNDIGGLKADVESLRKNADEFQNTTTNDIDEIQADVYLLKSDVRLILEKLNNLDRTLNGNTFQKQTYMEMAP